MHEQPVVPPKWMTVGLLHRRADRRADVRQKQRGLNMRGELAEVGIRPGGRDAAVQRGPLPVPYQPSPKPSPLVGSAPIRACKLWSTIPWSVLKSSSSISTG